MGVATCGIVRPMRVLIVPSALLLLVSCGGGDSSSTAAGPVTAAETSVAAVTTTTSATTGRRQESDCTDVQNFDDSDGDGWGYCVPKVVTTTTEKTTSTTENPDIGILLLGSAIENDPDVRQILIDLVTDADFSVESVDLLTFETTDQGTATLVVSVTTGYSSQDIIDEIAWAVAKDLGFAWAADEESSLFRNDGGIVLVGLRLTVDASTYTASYEQMVAVADVRIASADWLAQTRI